jgi:LmbE family N-acetylglucosaminyl deacetylase
MHRDHERAAQAALRAAFLASIPLEEIDAERHSVPTILHAENWEDMEGFTPSLYVPIPDEAFYRWVSAIRHQAFARGETYGFRYIDYYTALMTTRGCLASYPRACAFHTSRSPEVSKLAGP